jgi:membrane protein DedA with SNARE-associated domain
MTGLPEPLAGIASWLDQYGYFAVSGGILLESFGVPLPGETMLIAAAALAANGALELAPLLACAWIAAVVGDNIGFAIGHFGGRRLVVRYGARIGITDARLDKVEKFFERFGGEVVLVARFFAIARQLNGIVAGTVGMNWWRFLAYNGIGAALWVGAWGGGVYALGEKLGGFAPWIHRFGYLALSLVALALVAGVVLHWRRAAGSAERG